MRLFLYRYGGMFAALFLLFFVAGCVRPLLPIDETRYMTVAWEMHLRHDPFLLTMNFEPYHHKPPLLFWLINMSWSVFGINRWAALVPIYLIACAALVLSRELTLKILPGRHAVADRAPWIMLGSVPFLIYSSLIMFDMTMMVLIMSVLIVMLSYAERRSWHYIMVSALLLGFALLTKGPVAYIYVLPPMLLAPLWFGLGQDHKKTTWYAGVTAMIIFSVIPVLCWLIPTLHEADKTFALTMLWEQSAGRVTGHFGNSHARPFYFYLMILPLLILPWAFLPPFWKNIRNARWPHGFKFLACWLLPVFLVFSLISGKQPHYLLPLLPGVVVFIAYQLNSVSLRVLATVGLSGVLALTGGHIFARHTLFKPYDLEPAAQEMRTNPDLDTVYAGEYHGEYGFLARLEKPMPVIEKTQVEEWLRNHPKGVVILKHGVVKTNEKAYGYEGS